MLIVMPLLLLVIFGYAANFYVDSSVTTAVVGPQADAGRRAAAGVLRRDGDRPRRRHAGRRRAAAAGQQGRRRVRHRRGSPSWRSSTARTCSPPSPIVAALNKAGDAVTTEVLYNPELKTSWVMVPAIIGLILTFIGTIITSIGLVREREAGTLEQLAVMPIKPSTVILGKIAPYFLLAALDMVIVTCSACCCSTCRSTATCCALRPRARRCSCSSCSGSACSSRRSRRPPGRRSRSAFMFLLPQILLSGMIFPLDAMAAGRALDRLPAAADLLHDDLPAGSCCAAHRSRRCGCAFLVLAVMALVVFTGATLRFRRDLAPGLPRTRAAAGPRSASGRSRPPVSALPARRTGGAT